MLYHPTRVREIWRVLKQGGRLGISTGSKDDPNQLQIIKARVLARDPYRRYVPAAGDGTYRLSPGELEQLLVQTGFAIQTLQVRPHVRYHPTPEAAIAFAEASAFGNFLGPLPVELRRATSQEIQRKLEQLRTPEGIRREGARIVAVARKP
jgi:hypothetical protein